MNGRTSYFDAPANVSRKRHERFYLSDGNVYRNSLTVSAKFMRIIDDADQRNAIHSTPLIPPSGLKGF